MRAGAPGVVALILFASFATSAVSGEDVHPICPLVLQQERVNRVERELAVDLAESRLAAAESIFELVDKLWKKDAVDRMSYLTAKHDRDVLTIELKRKRLLLERQEAEVEQYESVCSPSGPAHDETERRAAAHRRYLEVDCHRIGKELAIAEVDLAYRLEFLASVRDLRKHAVATQQAVIGAERDVDLARKRVDRHGPRVRQCSRPGETGAE